MHYAVRDDIQTDGTIKVQLLMFYTEDDRKKFSSCHPEVDLISQSDRARIETVGKADYKRKEGVWILSKYCK